ncbi:MAG: glycosyltransferase family 4 protein [Candidatus Cloacimonetes bacterium]|nr:glycosyltransferase family 4 protein [Candidatus Cloacimonadota bacterium]
MKILIIADPIDEQYAGVYYYTRNLIENLLKIDKENEYVFLHLKKNSFFKDKKEYIVPGTRKFPGCMIIRKLLFIPFAIRKIKPDIVFEPAHIGPFSFFYKCKKIVVIHDLTPILFSHYHVAFSGLIHKIFLPLIIRNVDGIVVPSQSTKADLIKLFNVSKPVSVTDEAAAENFYPKSANEIKQVREKFEIEKDYIIAVGTLEPRKNLKIVLEVFSKIKTEFQDIQFVIVGKKGWKINQFLKEIKKIENDIIVTGYVDDGDLPRLYSGASVMIFPSIYEGFGLPPLEAMQCGCPVVCSNTSSLPEVCGEAAILFDPENPEELEDAMKIVLSDKDIRKKMKKKGLEQSSKFSWQKCAEETINFFQQINNNEA